MGPTAKTLILNCKWYKALGEIGEPAKDAVPALIEALEALSNENLRLYAVRALGQIGTPEAQKAVKEYKQQN
ncbi:MAG: HEAT repeat domain-containing protein [Candidatus Poribacteria bacterium]